MWVCVRKQGLAVKSSNRFYQWTVRAFLLASGKIIKKDKIIKKELESSVQLGWKDDGKGGGTVCVEKDPSAIDEVI